MSYANALDQLLKNEGGWYDGSQTRDLNPTMFGVTQKRYDQYRGLGGLVSRSVRLIEDTEVKEIYRTYWDAIRGDELPPHTANTVFDHAVNAGPDAAVKILQRSLGVVDDGTMGWQTMAAIKTMPDFALALTVGLERLRFYCDLVGKNPLKLPNLAGWVRRTVSHASRTLKLCKPL